MSALIELPYKVRGVEKALDRCRSMENGAELKLFRGNKDDGREEEPEATDAAISI